MSNGISLGLLEFGDRGDENSLIAINQILEYAIEADRLNFSRFWLGEHHGPDPRIPFTNPEILITLVAGMTENIRVGSAGTLVKMYEPYSVVTNFKLLNNLFSNRIDLGLAKGNIEIKYFKDSINLNKENLFESKLEKLYDMFYREIKNFKEKEIVIPPFKGNIPQIWYLSNSYKKFNDVIKYKLNLCISLIHSQKEMHKDFDKEQLLAYKEVFYNENKFYPKISLAVGISIGKTIREAQNKFEEAFKNEGNRSEAWRIIPVTMDYMYDMLNDHQIFYGIDEFALFDIESENKQKIENIQRISESFNL